MHNYYSNSNCAVCVIHTAFQIFHTTFVCNAGFLSFYVQPKITLLTTLFGELYQIQLIFFCLCQILDQWKIFKLLNFIEKWH